MPQLIGPPIQLPIAHLLPFILHRHRLRRPLHLLLKQLMDALLPGRRFCPVPLLTLTCSRSFLTQQSISHRFHPPILHASSPAPLSCPSIRSAVSPSYTSLGTTRSAPLIPCSPSPPRQVQIKLRSFVDGTRSASAPRPARPVHLFPFVGFETVTWNNGFRLSPAPAAAPPPVFSNGTS